MIIFGVFNPEKGTAFDNALYIPSDDEEKIAARSRYRTPVFQSVANHTVSLYEFVEMFPLTISRHESDLSTK
jgi:hypothetical protein